MKHSVKTRLVMHYWIPIQDISQEYLQCELIHFSCLKDYLPNFDEVTIIFAMDNFNQDLLERYENKFISFHPTNISFKVIENHPSRESITFIDEISSKLNLLDGITFFCHNKGITNIGHNIESISKWIVAMYWYNLSNFNYPISEMIGASRLCAGILNYYDEVNTWTVHHWHYSGTFFWLNCKQIYDFIRRNNIEQPCLNSRNDTENWIGDIIPRNRASSPMYTIDASPEWIFNPYDNCDQLLRNYSSESDYNNFIEYYNHIMSNLENV